MEKENNVNNGQNYYSNIKENRFFDRSGNEWKFLAEVCDLAHCKMICAQHGVQCPIKRSAYCVQLNCIQFVWFKKSKGCKGFDCPYRLLLIRQKQVTENCCFGNLFQRGEHSHPFIPECMCLKFWKQKKYVFIIVGTVDSDGKFWRKYGTPSKSWTFMANVYDEAQLKELCSSFVLQRKNDKNKLFNCNNYENGKTRAYRSKSPTERVKELQQLCYFKILFVPWQNSVMVHQPGKRRLIGKLFSRGQHNHPPIKRKILAADRF